MNNEDAKTIIKLLTDIREILNRTLFLHAGAEYPDEKERPRLTINDPAILEIRRRMQDDEATASGD